MDSEICYQIFPFLSWISLSYLKISLAIIFQTSKILSSVVRRKYCQVLEKNHCSPNIYFPYKLIALYLHQFCSWVILDASDFLVRIVFLFSRISLHLLYSFSLYLVFLLQINWRSDQYCMGYMVLWWVCCCLLSSAFYGFHRFQITEWFVRDLYYANNILFSGFDCISWRSVPCLELWFACFHSRECCSGSIQQFCCLSLKADYIISFQSLDKFIRNKNKLRDKLMVQLRKFRIHVNKLLSEISL